MFNVGAGSGTGEEVVNVISLEPFEVPALPW